MPSKQIHKRFWSLFLLSAFLLPLVASEAHVLLEHQELKKKCLAAEGDQHYHNSSDFEYHCLLCCSKLSELADLFEGEPLLDFPAEKNNQPRLNTSHHISQPFYSTAQRAPPAVVA